MAHAGSRQFHRREMLAALGAGALLAGRARGADSGLPFAGIDHLGITVADAHQSAAFYARLFGNTVYKNNKTPRRYLKLGPCYMAIAPPEQGPKEYRVDHFCPGVLAPVAEVKRYLQDQGIAARASDFGLFINDPDGIQIQFWKEHSWSESIQPAAAESYPEGADPIFQPTGLDHILLNVTDTEKSAAYYEKLFGAVTQRKNNRTWFRVGTSRIGLLGIAEGRRPGVNHFCVSAAAFEYDAVIKKLEQAGAKVRAPEVMGAPEFHDPDGILVQVMTPRGA